MGAQLQGAHSCHAVAAGRGVCLAAGVQRRAGLAHHNHAKETIATEASGLRDALILAQSMPAGTQAPLRTLIGAYVAQSVNKEWPAMAENRITALTHNVCGCSEELLTALQYMRGLKLEDERVIQRDIIDALEKVRVARRERILVSEDDAAICALSAWWSSVSVC